MISKKSKIWKVLLTARIGLTILSNSLWQTVEAMNWALPSAEYIWDRQTVVAVDYNSWTGLCQTQYNDFDSFWTELVPCWAVDPIITAVQQLIIKWKQISDLDPSETIHSSNDNQDWILYYQQSTNKTYVSTRQQQLNQGVERYFDANWQVTTFEFSLMLTRKFSPSSIRNLGESAWARNYMKQLSWIDFLTPQTKDKPMIRETAIVLLMKAAWAKFTQDELNFYNNWWTAIWIWDSGSNYDDITRQSYPNDSLYIKLATNLKIIWWQARKLPDGSSSYYPNKINNPQWNMTRREFTKMMTNALNNDISWAQVTLLKGMNYSPTVANDSYFTANNWTIYWKYANSAQIEANANNWNQKIWDFIEPNGTLIFKDTSRTWPLMKSYNSMIGKYNNVQTLLDPSALSKNILNYSTPKYYNPEIAVSWQDITKQIQFSFYNIVQNVWSKFEFEQLFESYRSYANKSPFRIPILQTGRQLTYAEIYLYANRNYQTITPSMMVVLECFYNILPNYSILY